MTATATALRFTRLPDPAPGLRTYSVHLGAQDIGTVTNRRGGWWRATTPAGHGRGSFHYTRRAAADALRAIDPPTTPDTEETSDMTTPDRITLTERDSADQVDLYVDGQLVVPALTADDRTALFFRLAQLDAAVSFPYDVRTVEGLELPPGCSIVHNASLGHLAVYGGSEEYATQELDRRLGEDYVREQAVALAADVSRRVREGEL